MLHCPTHMFQIFQCLQSKSSCQSLHSWAQEAFYLELQSRHSDLGQQSRSTQNLTPSGSSSSQRLSGIEHVCNPSSALIRCWDICGTCVLPHFPVSHGDLIARCHIWLNNVVLIGSVSFTILINVSCTSQISLNLLGLLRTQGFLEHGPFNFKTKTVLGKTSHICLELRAFAGCGHSNGII